MDTWLSLNNCQIRLNLTREEDKNLKQTTKVLKTNDVYLFILVLGLPNTFGGYDETPEMTAEQLKVEKNFLISLSQKNINRETTWVTSYSLILV